MKVIRKPWAIVFTAVIMSTVLLPIIQVVFSQSSFAQGAPVTGTWIDLANISSGGARYADIGPYDNTREYREGGRQGGCTNVITVTDSDGSQGSFSEASQSANGDCFRNNVQVTLGNAAARAIGAYRIDEETLLGYPFGADALTQGMIEALLAGSTGRPISFRRLPAGDPALAANPSFVNRYFLVGEDGALDTSDNFYIQAGSGANAQTCFEREGSDPCIDIIIANNNDVATAAMLTAVGVDPSNPTAGDGDDTTETDNSCESKGDLSWILCPVIRITEAALNWVDTQIQALLEVNKDAYDKSRPGGAGLHKAWTQIRNVSFIILVPIMLVMVIGTALNVAAIDAYTVKRSLPRMLIAVLFITLSWEICVFLIELFNAIGFGILGILTSPFDFGDGGLSLTSLFSGGIFSAIVAAPTTAAFIVGIIVVAWLFGSTLLLASGIAFLVLLLRQMFIIALLMVAPLAILSWIFPGNDKLWKTWWGTFSKLLMMFPLIMAVIAVGRIFAWIIHEGGAGDAGLQGAVLNPLMTLAAYMLPYAFIPFTFKFAGGLFANLAGIANDRSKGVFDRQRQKRAQKRQDAHNFSAFSDRNPVGRAANNFLGGATNLKAFRRGRAGFNTARTSGRATAAAEKLKNDRIAQTNQGNDAYVLALASEAEAEERITQTMDDLKLAQASGDTEKQLSLEHELDSRRQGLNAARQTQGRKTKGVQMAALQQLTQTGYQLDYGEAGYGQLNRMAREITGSDEQAFSAVMNQAQYNLKNAGRLDLAGINNGAGPDVKGGVRKAGNYGRGQGKTGTYYGGAGAWLGASAVDAEGKTAKDAATLAHGIEESLTRGQTSVEDVIEWHGMLLRDLPSATDANKLEIQKQIDAIEAARPTGPAASIARGENPLASGVINNRAQLQRDAGMGIDPSELDKK